MNNVLLTCPSRGRPELLKKMIESYNDTISAGTKLAIYLDDDDPKLKEYCFNIQNEKGRISSGVWVMPRMNVAQIHNWLINQYPDYDYYMPINDDITFQTKEWSNILINAIKEKGNGWGISYGNDTTGNDKYNLPTFGMVSANIVMTLGYLYPLELKMMFGDTFLLDIGRALGKLYYCPEVIIKHSPPGFAKDAFVPGDYRMSPTLYKEEQLAYAKYIDNKLDLDVKTLFDAITNNKLVNV